MNFLHKQRLEYSDAQIEELRSLNNEAALYLKTTIPDTAKIENVNLTWYPRRHYFLPEDMFLLSAEIDTRVFSGCGTNFFDACNNLLANRDEELREKMPVVVIT